MTGRWRVPDAQLSDYAQQHVGHFPAEAGAHDGEVDSPAGGVLGCFLDTRTDPDEMNCAALSDDRPLESSAMRSGRVMLPPVSIPR
jgi:hypothetical protein